MTDQPSHQPGTDRRATVDQPSAERDALTIGEAAARLGLSTDAVRSRLHRGTLSGERSPDGWTVFLPRTAPTVDRPSPPGERPETDRAPTVADGRFVGALEDRIIAQAEEITFLRDQLDQRSRELAAERERSDIIQQLALNRIPQLPMGDSDESRTEPQESPPTGQGEVIATNTGQDTSQIQGQSWWRRWFG